MALGRIEFVPFEAILNLRLAPYPHPACCPQCREQLRCNYCGGFLGGIHDGRCTNGRCARCHPRHCTQDEHHASRRPDGPELGARHFADTPGERK